MRVFGKDQGWSAGLLELPTGDVVGYAGSVCASVGERVALIGRYVEHEKYGEQFKVELAFVELPIDPEGLARFLEQDEQFTGIGPARARAIVNALELMDEDLATVLEDPAKRNELARRADIPTTTIELLAARWAEAREENAAGAQLVAMGLTAKQAEKILVKFGGSAAIAKLEQDPYVLYRDLDGFGFRRADDIALRIGVKKDAPTRIDAAILHLVDEKLREGHTWTLREMLVAEADQILLLDRMEDREKVVVRLARLTGPNDRSLLDEATHLSDRPLVAVKLPGVGVVVARRAFLKMEADLYEQFRSEETCASRPGLSADETDAWLAANAPDLNDEQKAAIRTATWARRLVVTGAAGSGKTFVIGALVRLYEAKGLSVSVAAPTGRASKRLEEVLARQGARARPTTVHRLLEFHPEVGWRRDRESPLEVDLVVVDEASMLDVELAWRITEALPKSATLVLVGDQNQLPPVGPGAVLRDLVVMGPCEVAALTRVVRQGGALASSAREILSGKLPQTSDCDPTTGRPAFVLKSDCREASDAHHAVVELFEFFLEKLGASALERVQVIAPQRRGDVGVLALNAAIQKLVQKRLRGIELSDARGGEDDDGDGAESGLSFLLGDKVMQLRNDYELDLMNGDQGTIRSFDAKGNVTLEVSSGTRASARTVVVPARRVLSLTHAYAITTHKAQGSEWDYVIAVVHKSHSLMLNRNLFYTAVTRAAKACYVIGDEWGLREAVRRIDADERRTFLAPWRPA